MMPIFSGKYINQNIRLNTRKYANIDELRHVAVHMVVLFMAITVAPAMIVTTMIRCITVGCAWIVIVHLSLALMLLYLQYFKHQYSTKSLTYLLVVGFFAVGVSSTIWNDNIILGGMHSAVPTMLLVTLISTRCAIAFQIGNAGVLLILGSGYENFTIVVVEVIFIASFAIPIIYFFGEIIAALATSLAMEQSIAKHERERILHELHDGLGNHLTTAVNMLNQDKINKNELQQVLTESIDQIRLSIDAIHLPHNNITSLLASLRYRLDKRIAQANMKLHWQVDELPDVIGFDNEKLRHLQFVIYEAPPVSG